MAGVNVGATRAESFWRLASLLYFFTIFPIVATIGIVGGIVFFVADVLLGLLLNRGLSTTSGMGLAGIAARLFQWPRDQLGWLLVGEPSMFRFLP